MTVVAESSHGGKAAPPSVLDFALSYLRAGISVIPVRRDGTKAPALRSWNPYREALADEAQARDWWGRPNPPGIAAVCGDLSGGLEVIDFDREAEVTYPRWRALVGGSHPGLLARLTVIRTPAGYHVWLRCGDRETPGNTKLAVDPDAPPDDRTLIETRGEGGYALVPGCPAECHRSGRLYVHESGPPLRDLADISLGERDALMSCARSLDRSRPADRPGSEHADLDRFGGQARPAGRKLKMGEPYDKAPGDDYDLRGESLLDLVLRYGAVKVSESNGEVLVRRPGKKEGHSASIGHCTGGRGEELLRVFTDNWPPFKDGQSYGRFRAKVELEYGGDFVRATADLKAQGYGKEVQTNGKAACPAQPPPAPAPAPPEVLLENYARKRMRPLRWLVPDFIPLGALTVVAGDGGFGKSSLTLHMAACVTGGCPCFGLDYEAPPAGRVLLAGCEDSEEETVLPRLAAAGASLELAESVQALARGADLSDWTLSPAAVDALGRKIEELGDVLLVVVDPVGAFVPERLDDHKNSHVRQMLRPLAAMAERTGVAVVLVSHLNKSDSASGGNLISGSKAYSNAARAAFLVGADPFAGEGEEGRRVLVFCKRNLTRRGKGLAFRAAALPPADQDEVLSLPQAALLTAEQKEALRGQLFRLEWLGETDATERDLASARKGREPGEGGVGGSKVERCVGWLQAFLARYAYPSSEVLAAAEAEGFTFDNLKEAKARLKAKGLHNSNKGVFQGVWWTGLGKPDTWTHRPDPSLDAFGEQAQPTRPQSGEPSPHVHPSPHSPHSPHSGGGNGHCGETGESGESGECVGAPPHSGDDEGAGPEERTL